jgi:hypothetical protein
MSTRATYQFKGSHADVTFYIHSDGYPEGGAYYFAKALKYEKEMKTVNHELAEIFFRANDRAEFTSGHDAHGDTEFRYTVTGPEDYRFGTDRSNHILVEDSDGGKVFKGTVEEFVQEYNHWDV